jgi:hypothetical protein
MIFRPMCGRDLPHPEPRVNGMAPEHNPYYYRADEKPLRASLASASAISCGDLAHREGTARECGETPGGSAPGQ